MTSMFLIILHSFGNTPFLKSQAELLTLIILISTAVLIPFLTWAWRRWYVYPRTFILDYPLFPYGDKRDLDTEPSKRAKRSERIGIGQRSVEVRIQVRYAIEIENFNFRFVNNNGTRVPSSTITIRGIQDQVTITRGAFTFFDDTYGGRDCVYTRVTRKGKKEYLRFILDVDAQREWEGLLSFMGYDKNGKRVFARQRFEVKG